MRKLGQQANSAYDIFDRSWFLKKLISYVVDSLNGKPMVSQLKKKS